MVRVIYLKGQLSFPPEVARRSLEVSGPIILFVPSLALRLVEYRTLEKVNSRLHCTTIHFLKSPNFFIPLLKIGCGVV